MIDLNGINQMRGRCEKMVIGVKEWKLSLLQLFSFILPGNQFPRFVTGIHSRFIVLIAVIAGVVLPAQSPATFLKSDIFFLFVSLKLQYSLLD